MPSVEERILIIGSDGFVGRNFVRYCEREGWDAETIGRADGDLSDWPTVEGLFRRVKPVNRIYHLVTHQRTGNIQYQKQAELLAINARIHLNVLEAWRRYQPEAKLICPGSSCTYPESEIPISEVFFGTGPMHRSVMGYAQAKLLLARGCEAYASQYDLKYLVTIFATLYGPFDHKAVERSHFMGAMVERALQERANASPCFTVWGSTDAVRELLYVDDQIAAMLAADAAFENRIINCACNAPITVGDAAKAVLEALAWNVPLHSPPGSFQGVKYKVIDSSDFLAATQFRPRYDMTEGVRKLLSEECRT